MLKCCYMWLALSLTIHTKTENLQMQYLTTMCQNYEVKSKHQSKQNEWKNIYKVI